MTRRMSLASAFLLVLLTLSIPPALALEENERLWLVGERAFADNLFPLAARALDRFVTRYPDDSRVPQAFLLLGRARLSLNDNEGALDAFRRAGKLTPPPGQPMEARFWEAEALFRLKRYQEARAAYDDVIRTNAAAPFAADALYGFGWTELEMKRPDPAVTAFREFLQSWPDNRLAPSATYQLARALIEQKKYKDAIPLLAGFSKKYPDHKLVADAQYLLGWTKIRAGDTKGGVADLKAFVEAYPTHELSADARKLVTSTAARSGDRSELQETYASLMNQNPPTPEGLAEAVSVAGRLGRVHDQEAAWKKMAAEFPTHPLTRKLAFDLASSAFKRKDWSQAVTLGESAARSDDESTKAEAWLLVGESDLKLKRFAAAVKAFEAVGAVDGVDGGVRYRALAGLGLAREEQKELRAALTAYESVASKSPDAALREWARERAGAVRARLGTKSPTKPPAVKPRRSS
jgi:TolA-binding protein